MKSAGFMVRRASRRVAFRGDSVVDCGVVGVTAF